MIVAYSARTGEQLWRWSNRRMASTTSRPTRRVPACTSPVGTGGAADNSSSHPRSTGARENGYGGRASTPRSRAARTTSRSHPTVGRSTSRARYAARTRGCTGSSVAYEGSSGSRRWTGHLGRAYRQGFASDLSVTPDGVARAGRHGRRARRLPRGSRCTRAIGRRPIVVQGARTDPRLRLRASRGRHIVGLRRMGATETPTLASLDPSDGTVIWSHDLPRLRLVSTLAATPSVLVVEGGIRRLGTVAAFDSDDGTRAWSTELRRVEAYGIYALHAPASGDAATQRLPTVAGKRSSRRSPS